jgi:hypothetical protein
MGRLFDGVGLHVLIRVMLAGGGQILVAQSLLIDRIADGQSERFKEILHTTMLLG